MTTKKKKKGLKATELVTPRCRLAFPSLHEASKVSNDADAAEKFQAVVLIPPGEETAAFKKKLKAAIDAAMMEKWGKIIKIKPDKRPVHKCEEKDDVDGYEEGWLFINAKSNYQPKLVNAFKKPVEQDDIVETFYPGCYCHFFLSAYAWDNKWGKGVNLSLDHVMFAADGDRLDGRRSSEEAFGDIEVEDEDELFDTGDDDEGDVDDNVDDDADGMW